MAKINSKIDEALRKEVIENGVFLGTVLIFGFNDNIYLYENEVYVEQFKLTDDDYVVTDFYQGSWEVINTNIYNGKFNANEPYTEALIDYMNLYNRSLYLGNKKYREIAKEQFAELKKDYQESGLLDDINALLKKSKSKTFRYSKYESEKSARKSIKEERYNVELSDYNGSIVDEETFDKKSDAIQWAKDNGRNCYARIWDNEEGKTVKEWKVKSIKESKVMTFEEFKKLCNDNFGYAIMDFNEYKGAYIVVVSSNEKATELFTKALRKRGLECTFYELKDPNSEYYRCYEIMCV